MTSTALAMLALASACGFDGAPTASTHNPTRDAYNTWEVISPPGASCSDGSPYKFFANFSKTSDNLVVAFEPGGACWDYPGCTGADGDLGASNLTGIDDNHYTLGEFVSPFLNRGYQESPSRDWNYVFVSYCTGDVHTGNTVATYTSSDGTQSVQFDHDGHAAVEQVVSWIDDNFTHVPKMLVTGCSAGGVGSLINYYYLRNGVSAVERSYLLDDSGPLFPDRPGGYSTLLHRKVQSAWNLDPLTPTLPSNFTFTDVGTLSTALADLFPDDRLAVTFFQRDHTFSAYSYQDFYTPTPTDDQMMAMWAADTQLFVDEYNTRANLYYYLPWYRALLDGHCTTVVDFDGSDFANGSVTIAGWINALVNDLPLANARETPQPQEDPS
jgi:hypothetical protein